MSDNNNNPQRRAGKEPANESQDSSSPVPIRRSARIPIPNRKFTSKDNDGSSSSRRNYDWDPWKCNSDYDWTDKIQSCPTFSPTEQEFQDPYAYIQRIAPQASSYGICKIVSPLKPLESAMSVLRKLKFSPRVLYLDTKYREEIYITDSKYDIEDLEAIASEDYELNYSMPARCNVSKIEKDFWKKIEDEKSCDEVGYVNGHKASGFSTYLDDPLGSSNWNLQKFARRPETALRHLERDIDGVTDPMIYIGMLYSYDFWHAEPGHLNRIEYHHYGEPKTWYGAPSAAATLFEELVCKYVFPKVDLETCEAYDILNLKALIFSPLFLVNNGVPVYKAVQIPGEFIVTFPKTYHAGFSNGFTCTEALNFTTRDWFPFGAESSERRALYDRPAIIPYQELLCKEAEDLWFNKQPDLHSEKYRDLKLDFACLIRIHHFACEEIFKSGTTLAMAPQNEELKYCVRCSRECYLAYVTCNCYSSAHCIFHDIYRGCRHCKEKRVIWVKEEILDLQNIATRFEEDGDVNFLEEVKTRLVKFSEVIGCLPSMNLQMGLEELLSALESDRIQNAEVPRRRRTNYPASGVA